ncbi:restriction endonuclease subunit S [Nocardia cyriacigeorgica]|uniref:restriction endonuclease subunit S n=1 Tax=Nocardia cyriacigeorgica TaxID=135487 RepID=UPI0009DA946F|nr:restriction endonuclease subunit S [Nocardia cyriacigeorgica]AVH24222.1 restriction endonuclease subunit S [Nocardia cyriacigeorgica]TLF55129.1 hypothetical protein FEK31_21365 [Nocardia cyriacigeorgica]
MKLERLDSVTTIIMGQAPPGESYNTDSDGWPLIAGAGDFNQGSPAPKKYTTKPSKLSRSGDILLGIRASIGDKVLADKEYCIGRGVASLRPNDCIDIRYLWNWLGFSSNELAAKGKGATFKQVNSQDIAEMMIPVPPIAQQRRIAEVLDHVDALREKRRKSIALLDDLAQSIFLDMFGDPVANSRGWDIGTVGHFVEKFESGKSLAPGQDGSESAFRVLKVSAVTSGTFYPTESKPLPAEYRPPDSHIVRPGDLIFCRANGNPDLIGVTTFVDQVEPRYALPDKLWRFVWNESSQVEPRFVHGLFSQPGFREQIRRSSTGNGVKNISQYKVLSQPTILPPRQLQRTFARTVAAIDANKLRMVGQLDALDTLFSSLQSRAFRGELWQDDLKDL